MKNKVQCCREQRSSWVKFWDLLTSCPTGLVQSEDQSTKTAVGRAKVTERATETPPAMATTVI